MLRIRHHGHYLPQVSSLDHSIPIIRDLWILVAPRRLGPPRPSDVPSQIPSPSIYSVRSGENSDPNLPLNSSNPYPYPTRPVRSFSHPNQRHHQPRPTANNETLSSTSTVDMSSHSPVGTDELFRLSTHSTSSSIPYASNIVPLPERAMPQSPRQASGLNIPPNTRRSRVQSSVSPIPEEIPDPRQGFRSYASSRVIPSSWGSGPAESEILGAYLDEGSSDEGDERHNHEHELTNPVRSASVGKRQRPTMRTIMKSNPSSEVSIPDIPNAALSYTSGDSTHDTMEPTKMTVAEEMNRIPTNGHITMRTPSPVRRGSISSLSGESCVDPEKPRFAKQEEQRTFRGALEKELETLPQAAPTMSDKRPNGRKPPRLNLDAVRGAEARGSLSSLTDLIRRATKLASNLDRGRTASRADLAGEGFCFNDSGYRGRTSGSLSDILASFPNPSVITPDTRSSWPVFFGGGGRSNLRNVEPLPSHDDVPEDLPSQRRCCGMPRKWFILVCILIFIVVVLAVLLPVFLVAVPRESAATHSCSHTTPCYHGGVSVSSGTECSCVCTDGYTGSQCTVVGDSSCVIAEVDSGGVHENATMGGSIPSLLDQSKSKFSIDLDAVTILALFNLRNISCESEDALVAFSEVDVSGSSGNSRRSILSLVDTDVNSTFQGKDSVDDLKQPATSTTTLLDLVSPAMEARSLASTSNGIYYDNSGTSEAGASSTKDDSKLATSAASSTTSITATAEATATATNTGASSTSTSSSANIPSEVLEFSRVAVLYILEKTGSIDSAKESETQIQTYLIDSYQSASHPAVEVLGWYSLDFENKTITTG
ncbi:uncharacterized protein N7483_007727 [Penicillium malachiteum]|uniref:uncharacterized protein n=1 Tax=Penicillium malachiteum TaxID=1324776 RepID=UPI002546698D|nr:uncharacterized protein N7483_007727 [Penicillium malachiteum]KAJ5726370.1 hypothetical protein N7483_007727 [Penicillium malachiteum]